MLKKYVSIIPPELLKNLHISYSEFPNHHLLLIIILILLQNAYKLHTKLL